MGREGGENYLSTLQPVQRVWEKGETACETVRKIDGYRPGQVSSLLAKGGKKLKVILSARGWAGLDGRRRKGNVHPIWRKHLTLRGSRVG